MLIHSTCRNLSAVGITYKRTLLSAERDEWQAHRQPAMQAVSGRLIFIDETAVKTNVTPLAWAQPKWSTPRCGRTFWRMEHADLHVFGDALLAFRGGSLQQFCLSNQVNVKSRTALSEGVSISHGLLYRYATGNKRSSFSATSVRLPILPSGPADHR